MFGGDGVGGVAGEAEEDGGVSGMADAGEREGAVKVDLDAGGLMEEAGALEAFGEGEGGAHGADRVGAGGAYADFEKFKETGHCLLIVGLRGWMEAFVRECRTNAFGEESGGVWMF